VAWKNGFFGGSILEKIISGGMASQFQRLLQKNQNPN